MISSRNAIGSSSTSTSFGATTPACSPGSSFGRAGNLGEFLFLDDRAEEGEAVFAALIEDQPDEAIGYARLSSIVAHGVRGSRAGGPSDVPRAIALLEQAIARPVQDASGWDIQARLEDLRSTRSLAAAEPDAEAIR